MIPGFPPHLLLRLSPGIHIVPHLGFHPAVCANDAVYDTQIPCGYHIRAAATFLTERIVRTVPVRFFHMLIQTLQVPYKNFSFIQVDSSINMAQQIGLLINETTAGVDIAERINGEIFLPQLTSSSTKGRIYRLESIKENPLALPTIFQIKIADFAKLLFYPRQA